MHLIDTILTLEIPVIANHIICMNCVYYIDLLENYYINFFLENSMPIFQLIGTLLNKNTQTFSKYSA